MDEVVNQCSHSATSNHRRKLVTRENADGNGAEQSVTLKLSEEEEGVNFAQSKIVVAFISVYTFVPFFPASLIVSSNPCLMIT